MLQAIAVLGSMMSYCVEAYIKHKYMHNIWLHILKPWNVMELGSIVVRTPFSHPQHNTGQYRNSFGHRIFFGGGSEVGSLMSCC